MWKNFVYWLKSSTCTWCKYRFTKGEFHNEKFCKSCWEEILENRPVPPPMPPRPSRLYSPVPTPSNGESIKK
jgi:hypothetical protein